MVEAPEIGRARGRSDRVAVNGRASGVAGFVACLLLTPCLGGDPGAARAQTPDYRFEWAKSISGPLEGDFAQDLVVAEDGSVYFSGSHGGLDLDGDGRVDVAAMSCGGPCPRSSMDSFLIKVSPQGDLLWLRSPDGPRTDWGGRIALDRRGGVYLTGLFRETLAFEDGPRLETHGDTDGFLARYDADGNVLWAIAIGGPKSDGMTAVTVDAVGNVYVTATVRGAIDVDGDRVADLEVMGEANPLMASFTPEGTLRWARTMNTPTKSFGGNIAVAPEGHLFVDGVYFDGTIDFDGDGRGDIPHTSGTPERFLARFESDGAFAWARTIKSGAFLVTGDGDLVVTGVLAPSVDLDGDGSPDGDASDPRTYLARLTPHGELVWSRTYGPVGVWKLSTDDDRLIMSGFYAGELDLDMDGVVDGIAEPDSTSEGFTAVLSADGDVERVFTVVGPGDDQVRAAGFSPDGSTLFAAGFVRLTADFEADGVVEGGIRCDAKGDLFVARYGVRAR